MKTTFLSLVMLAMTALSGFAQQSDHYQKRMAEFAQEPLPEFCTVMLGNSLVENCSDWATLLGNDQVRNRGIIGDIIQGYIDRLDEIIQAQPTRLFVSGGINDISHNVSADSIANAMEKLVMKVKAASPHTVIYIQSLLPVNNTFGRYKLLQGKEQVILDTNVRLRALADKLGVEFIDIFPSFVDSEGRLEKELTSDGLHINNEGYERWGHILRPYLDPSKMRRPLRTSPQHEAEASDGCCCSCCKH